MELTPFLNSTDSLAEQNNFMNGYDFESRMEVQTKKGNFSTISLPSLVKATTVVSSFTGTLQAATGVNITWSFKTIPSAMMIGQWYANLYQGTAVVGSLQFFPSINAAAMEGQYVVQNMGDVGFLTSGTQADKTHNTTHIYNTSGTVQTFFMTVKLKYIVNNTIYKTT